MRARSLVLARRAPRSAPRRTALLEARASRRRRRRPSAAARRGARALHLHPPGARAKPASSRAPLAAAHHPTCPSSPTSTYQVPAPRRLVAPRCSAWRRVAGASLRGWARSRRALRAWHARVALARRRALRAWCARAPPRRRRRSAEPVGARVGEIAGCAAGVAVPRAHRAPRRAARVAPSRRGGGAEARERAPCAEPPGPPRPVCGWNPWVARAAERAATVRLLRKGLSYLVCGQLAKAFRAGGRAWRRRWRGAWRRRRRWRRAGGSVWPRRRHAGGRRRAPPPGRGLHACGSRSRSPPPRRALGSALHAWRARATAARRVALRAAGAARGARVRDTALAARRGGAARAGRRGGTRRAAALAQGAHGSGGCAVGLALTAARGLGAHGDPSCVGALRSPGAAALGRAAVGGWCCGRSWWPMRWRSVASCAAGAAGSAAGGRSGRWRCAARARFAHVRRQRAARQPLCGGGVRRGGRGASGGRDDGRRWCLRSGRGLRRRRRWRRWRHE